MVTGADVVARARQELGDPYVFGAHGPRSFDCSGLVEYVYRQLGLHTPGTTSAMMGPGSNLIPITRGQLGPGDLVFSNWTGRRSSHVGIYAGNNQLIEAQHPGTVVKTITMGPTYWAHTDAYRRVPGLQGAGSLNRGQAGELVGALQSGLGAAGGPLGGVGLIPHPGSVTEALSNIGTAMANVASSAANVGEFAGLATRAFLPSNLIRGVAFMFGTIFLLIGIWFLARELRE